MQRLSPDAREQFIEDGYYVARGYVDIATIDDFLGDVGAVVRQHLQRCAQPFTLAGHIAGLYENLATLHRYDQGRYLATLLVCGKLKSLYDLFLSDSLADACRKCGVSLPMLHTHPLFHVMSHRLRLDNGYFGFGPHQDWSGLQTSLNTVVVWLPFHDIDAGLFPLEVLPKSHTNGLCMGAVTDRDYTIDSSYYVGRPFTCVEVRKGDAVFMSPFTIHRTGLTETDGLRIAASWRYEDAVEDTFIERGYPLAQSRTVRHDLFFPAFPSAEQVRRVLK